MKILGIDPGTSRVGFGLIEKQNSHIVMLDYGCLETEPNLPQEEKLLTIFRDFTRLLIEYKPDLVVLEKIFFFKNAKTVIGVSQARGVILLAAKQANVPISEYTPLQVKMSICDHGRADKKQIQKMIVQWLKLSEIPKPDDAADALAVAVCHANNS